MTGDTAAITEIESTSPMMRQVNTGLMVEWINRSLVSRSQFDIRKSLVLYDSDMIFVRAVPPALESQLNLSIALAQQGVRYYSKGIV